MQVQIRFENIWYMSYFLESKTTFFLNYTCQEVGVILKLPTESLKMVPEFFMFFEGGRVEG
jgi:hypothetical protein